jgi:hypothetical protein
MNFDRSELGELTGLLLIGLFILLGFRYVLKAYFVVNSKKLDKKSNFYKILVKVMALNKTFHPYVGYLAIVLILSHSYIQTGWQFFADNQTLTGYMTGSLFILNIGTGFIGDKIMKKPRPSWWIWVHRILTVLIGVSIIVHINQ